MLRSTNNLRAFLFLFQVEALRTNDVTWERVRSNVDHVVFKSGKRIVLLAEGRLLSLAATSIPSMVTSVNSCTQVREILFSLIGRLAATSVKCTLPKA